MARRVNYTLIPVHSPSFTRLLPWKFAIMASTRLLKDWSDDQIASLNSAILVANHRLAELDMFGDEGLIETLARHPAKDLGINTMGSDPARREEWREGRSGELSPEQLFACVRSGKLWLNLRRVMDHHTDYEDLVNELYNQMESICPGLSTYNRSANLLISSPEAIVYYHLDCPVNMLWHIRGTKRVWAYPLESGIVSRETIEGVLCGEKSEELDFRSDYDKLATVVDLDPGEIITWPQHTPHRVVNTSGLNVSLSTEHMTRAAARRNNVYLANRHFRTMFGGGFTNTATTGLAAASKELALRVARRLPLVGPAPPQGYEYVKTFTVDPTAPNCVRIDGQRIGAALVAGQTECEFEMAAAT